MFSHFSAYPVRCSSQEAFIPSLLFPSPTAVFMRAIQIMSLSSVAFLPGGLIVFYRLSEKRSNQGSECPRPRGRAVTFPERLELRRFQRKKRERRPQRRRLYPVASEESQLHITVKLHNCTLHAVLLIEIKHLATWSHFAMMTHTHTHSE